MLFSLELGCCYYFLIDGCICTWGCRRQGRQCHLESSMLPSVWGPVIHITLVEHIGADMLERLLLCEVKEVFAAGFGLTSFEIFPSFSEVLLYLPSFKMCQKGKKTWKVASAYRILITVHFCVLHVQVRTWAKWEQLPLTCYVTEWVIIWDV